MNVTAAVVVIHSKYESGRTGRRSMSGQKRDPGRRLRREGEEFRYFLAKPGSSADAPELGAEVESESEALIHRFN